MSETPQSTTSSPLPPAAEQAAALMLPRGFAIIATLEYGQAQFADEKNHIEVQATTAGINGAGSKIVCTPEVMVIVGSYCHKSELRGITTAVARRFAAALIAAADFADTLPVVEGGAE